MRFRIYKVKEKRELQTYIHKVIRKRTCQLEAYEHQTINVEIKWNIQQPQLIQQGGGNKL